MSIYFFTPEDEHRVVLKFCFKDGMSRDLAIEEIAMKYQNVDVQSLKEWWNRLKNGEQDFCDNDSMSRKMYNCILSHSYVTIELLAAVFCMSKWQVQTKLNELSWMYYMGRVVPCQVTKTDKHKREDFALDISTMISKDKEFPKKVVIGKQILVFKHDVVMKRAGCKKAEYLPRNEGRKILVFFFDIDGIFYYELIAEKNYNINAYLHVMKNAVSKIRKKYQEPNTWYLLLENSLPHNSIFVRKYFTENKIFASFYPTNSPDLIPADHHICWKVAQTFNAKPNDSIENIMESIVEMLSNDVVISTNFKRWKQYLDICIKKNGGYVYLYMPLLTGEPKE